MVPHLAGDHSEAESDGQHAPHAFVEQEVEVVAAQVQETADKRAQHKDGDRSRVVGRPENANLDVCSLLDPLGERLRGESDSLDVKSVGG